MWNQECAIEVLGDEAVNSVVKYSGAYTQMEDGTLNFNVAKDSQNFRLAALTFANTGIEGGDMHGYDDYRITVMYITKEG